LYRDTRIPQKTCTRTCKNHAMLRLFRLQRDPTLKRLFYSAASIRSATFTVFYCRAVSANSMNSNTLIVSLFLVFTSCISTRNTQSFDNSNELCVDISKINKIISSDSAMLDYFSASKNISSNIYYDSILHWGINYFLITDISTFRVSKDSTLNLNKVYSDLLKEQSKYIRENKQIMLPCIINENTKSQSNLETNYMFDPKDKLYFVEINLILKKPGFKKGYLYLFDKQEMKILKKTFWTE